jgi:hypothetical protein
MTLELLTVERRAGLTSTCCWYLWLSPITTEVLAPNRKVRHGPMLLTAGCTSGRELGETAIEQSGIADVHAELSHTLFGR